MKHTLTLLTALLFAPLAALLAATAEPANKPNVIIIFTDDMGYGDIGPFGDKHKTPHLDRMAAEGSKLTAFYVSSVACTPSRSSLMTGCYAQRIGMGGSVVFPADKRGLNPSEVTLAEMLKSVGYATGCFGKWHLGDQPEFLPTKQGFDEYEGIPYSNDMWSEAGKPKDKHKHPPLPYMKQDKVIAHISDGASQAVLTDALSDATVSFIQRHAKEPFFAYVPLATVHYPWFVTKARLDAAGGDSFAAQITEIDQLVGRVMETLKALAIDKNTLIFFTNDNGGAGKTFSGPLRGGKFGPEYEGRMRVPTLAWWPGSIPAGRVCAEIGTTADVLPTLASISGAAVPTDRIIDGKNISDLLLGKAGAKSPHAVLFYGDGGVRQGKWKLVRYRVKADWFDELYDLAADLGEKTNLAAQEPGRVKAMKVLLDAHNEELKKNVRPAGLVANPKPILPDATGIPTLAELRPGIATSTNRSTPDAVFQSTNAKVASQPTMTSKAGALSKAGQTSVRDDAYALVQQSQTWDTFPLYAKVGYDQALRPQFHFTSRVGWLNDPNGMVYYDGEWLMAFQHFAKGNASGAKSWGQAVSKDLMRWTQLPHALNPYPNVKWAQGNDHAIWSGSAIVDQFNALGKQKGEVKTIFAMFTATHAGEDKRAAFFQVGAYSTDKGRTWTMINDGNPLIDHLEGLDPGQRDPYLFFHAPTQSYRFIMEIGGPERAVRIWKSSDLMKWESVCDIPNKSAECINMYSVPVDGDPMNVKWVIANAGTGYEVGDFDGTKWTGLGDKDKHGRLLKFEYGDCYYAAQTFNQAPENRVVHVGWLRTGSLFTDAGMPFTQQMSIPAEITLRTTPNGLRMLRNPVKEIATLYAKTSKFDSLTIEAANAKLATLSPELIDMTIAFLPAGDLTLNVRGLPIQYDAAKNEFAFTNTVRVERERAAMSILPADKQRRKNDTGRRAIPAPEVNGQVKLRVLVDRTSLELFVNDGQAAASFVVVPDPKNRALSVQAAGAVKITSLEVNELKSSWSKQ